MTNTINSARENLKETRERMHTYYDPKRKPAQVYNPGNLVMLSTKNLKIKRPSKKLDHKYIGPFQVEKMIGYLAVRLILPAEWRTHPTFHVSTIEPYTKRNGTNLNYNQILREMSDIEADEEYDVHGIK